MRSTIDNSRYPRRSILIVGFGSSLLLHLGLMWGILRWWQPAVTGEDSIDITLVEPVESTPVRSTSPTTEIEAKPSSPAISTPITTAIAPVIRKRSSIPKTVKSPPKPIAIKPKSTPEGIGTKPSPKPLALANSGKPIGTTKRLKRGSPPTKPKGQPSRIHATKASPFPGNLSAAPGEDRVPSPPTRSFSLPISPTPKSPAKSTPTPVNSPIPTQSARSEPKQASASKPLAANPLPSSTPPASDRSNELIQTTPTRSNPLPLKTTAPIATIPNPPPTTLSPLPRSANNFQQPQDPSRSTKNPPIDSNNDRQVNPNPAGGGVMSQQGGTNLVNSGSFSSSNSGDRAGAKNGAPTGNLANVNGTGSDRGKTGGTGTGKNSGTGTGTGTGTGINSGTGTGTGTGNSGLQCIKNCQIAKLQDLQDSDGGKDRLRIRVTIDANGIVTAAEISKSSGNPQIDRSVLEGIERMQFQPTGKPIKGIIRANIFL